MNASILSAALFRLAIGAALILIGAGLIPAPASLIALLACGAVDVLILWAFWEAGRKSRDAQPAPPVDPGKPVPGPDPGKPVSRKPRNTGITTTEFGGAKDPNNSAYDDHFITDTELTASLPATVPSPRGKLRVFSDNGGACDCDVGDKGPWNTNDDYWNRGARPAAEAQYANRTKATNGRVPSNSAGLDLSPGVWKKLGLAGVGEAKMDWDWVSYLDATAPPSPAASVSGAAIIAIVTSLDGALWTEGNNPAINAWIEEIAAKWPDLATYARTFENHGYFAWCGLTAGYVMSKAGYKPPSEFFLAANWLKFGSKVWDKSDGVPISQAQPQPGDVLVYQWSSGSDAGGHHVSIYDHETDGGDYASHGGNQSHTVNITQFPMSACIGIRRPA